MSASSGSALTALVLAARAAFSDLHVPRTKKIGWEGAADEATHGGDLAGMKAALQAGKGSKGKAKGRRPRGGDDWELDTTDGGLEYLQGREELPVLVTLNLVSFTLPDVRHELIVGSGLPGILHRRDDAGGAGVYRPLTPLLQ